MQDLFFFVRRFARNLSARADFVPPLLARIVIGVVFVQSGWGKLHDLDRVVAFFTELGIPAPQIQAPFVAGTELVCGALVLVGLAARAASVPLIATMIVALVTAQAENLSSLGDLFGTIECLYAVLLVGLVVQGAGTVSVDAWISTRLDAADPSVPRCAHGAASAPARA